MGSNWILLKTSGIFLSLQPTGELSRQIKLPGGRAARHRVIQASIQGRGFSSQRHSAMMLRSEPAASMISRGLLVYQSKFQNRDHRLHSRQLPHGRLHSFMLRSARSACAKRQTTQAISDCCCQPMSTRESGGNVALIVHPFCSLCQDC